MNSKRMKSNVPWLPPGIVQDILSRLPVQPLVRFRCVNKHWETLLTTDNFIRKHLTHKSENPDMFIQFGYKHDYYLAPNGVFETPVKLDSSYLCQYDERETHIVGSVNGLICLSHECHSERNLFLSIWNPATRECKTLPDPEIEPLDFKQTTMNSSLGFGFHAGLNDYKVVKFTRMNYYNYGSEVLVYTLRTNSWRRVGICPYSVLASSARVVINGVLHWLAKCDNSEEKSYLILSLDLADEVFREVPLPDTVVPKGVENFHLSTFGGCLSMFAAQVDKPEINMWTMKEYGVKDSWEKQFLLEHHKFCIPNPYGFLINGELLEILIERDEGMSLSFMLVSYNFKNKSLKEVEIGGIRRKCILDIIPYVESLVVLMGADNSTKGEEVNGLEFRRKGRPYGETNTAVVDEGLLFSQRVEFLYSFVGTI